MAWKKGQSGNPGGRSQEQPVTDAIRAACNETDPKTQRRKLQLIGEKVVSCAVAGQQWAIEMVADRLDGKPTENINHRFEPALNLTDVAIVERLGDLRARAFGGVTEAPIDPSQLN